MDSIKHITLIRPPIVTGLKPISGIIVPPIGLAYLISQIESKNVPYTLIDAAIEGHENLHYYPEEEFRLRGLDLFQVVQKIPADTSIIGLSHMFSSEWVALKKLIKLIHQKFPHIPLMLGGEATTSLYRYLLKEYPEISICVLGESDTTILDIIDHFPHLEKVSGIAYRKNRKVIKSQPRMRIKKSSEISWPAWHAFNIPKYFQIGDTMGPMEHPNPRILPLMASRGCPYKCTFCSNQTMWGINYTSRSPAEVVDEIENNLKNYHINGFEFCDLTAFLKKSWIMDFTAELKKRNLSHLRWTLPIGTRTEVFDKDVLTALYDSNIKQFSFVPESGSKRILQIIKKKVDLKKMLKSLILAKQIGHCTRIHIIMGFPFETKKDLFYSLLFMVKAAYYGCDDCSLFQFVPYPGAAIFDDLVKEKKIIINHNYFKKLLNILSFDSSVKSYSPHFSNTYLYFFKMGSLSLFYLLSLLFYPKRIPRLLGVLLNLRPGKSLFELRIKLALKNVFSKPVTKS